MSLTREVDQAGTSARGAPGVALATTPGLTTAGREDHRCFLTAAPSYEPHGFEGFGSIGVGVEAGNLVAREAPDSGVITPDLLGAPRTTSELLRELKDPLSAVDRLLRLGSIRLPWSHPVKPECPEAVCSITAIAPLDTQQACDALKVG